MAFFVRTRCLDLNRLSRKPQENMTVVRTILSATVKQILARLKKLEKAFYGKARTPLEEIQKWVEPIQNILGSVHMRRITSVLHVNDIIRISADPRRTFEMDMYNLNKLKECVRKIRTTVPDKFSDMVLELKAVLHYLDQYCLSFYDPDDGMYLETAAHYERNRQEMKQAIQESLTMIGNLAEAFVSRDLHISDFTSFGVELARKGQCSSLPFLVLFPESCECIRNVCSAMSAWLSWDASYVVFLRNDMGDLEREKDDKIRVMRDSQQQFHQLGFRLKQLQTEHDKKKEELERLRSKEDDLTIEEEVLIMETNDIQLDIEMKEYRREELVRNAATLHPQVLYERYSELSEDLRDLKLRLPYAKRELAAVRHKLGWLGSKRQELKLIETKLAEVSKEMERIDQLRQEHELEHDQASTSLELARKIHLRKSSTDSLEKIYHQRPVEVNKSRLPGQGGKNDPFEKACFAVAMYIETDWPKLYRALPFHPQRGKNTVDQDIGELTNEASRTSTQQTALRALYRWRRHHTRAKLEDLKETLSLIKKVEVLDKLEKTLNPPVEPPKEEPKITYVEEYLIPFAKEVERFDELRAANKI